MIAVVVLARLRCVDLMSWLVVTIYMEPLCVLADCRGRYALPTKGACSFYELHNDGG